MAAAAVRIDVYADSQAWDLQLADLHRFVCRGRVRRGFVERDHAFASGRRLTGFMFGRGALAARLYDKTVEIERRGVSWLPDLWGEERAADRPVWRLEFQVRREALAEFQLRSVDEVLASAQDLWRYGTIWLTLRVPTRDRRERRWPLDLLWREVQAVTIAPAASGVVRRRLLQAAEERLVQGLQGYVTSWAALRGGQHLHGTLEAVRPILERYLASRGRTFAGEVKRKRARLMSVTAFLDGDGSDAA